MFLTFSQYGYNPLLEEYCIHGNVVSWGFTYFQHGKPSLSRNTLDTWPTGKKVLNVKSMYKYTHIFSLDILETSRKTFCKKLHYFLSILRTRNRHSVTFYNCLIFLTIYLYIICFFFTISIIFTTQNIFFHVQVILAIHKAYRKESNLCKTTFLKTLKVVLRRVNEQHLKGVRY